MIRKAALLALALLFAAGCAAQPIATATATTTATSTASATTTALGTFSQQDALALADEFYDLFVTRQDYAKAITLFDEQMKAALPENKLKEIWATLPQQVGAFQSRSNAQLSARQDPYQRAIIPLQFEKMALNMLVVIDVTTGKISGLFFQPNQAAQAQQYKTPSYVDTTKFEEKDVTIGTEPRISPSKMRPSTMQSRLWNSCAINPRSIRKRCLRWDTAWVDIWHHALYRQMLRSPERSSWPGQRVPWKI